MPDLNIRNVDKTLITAVNVEAAKAQLTQRDFVLKVLTKAVGWEKETEVKHVMNPKPKKQETAEVEF